MRKTFNYKLLDRELIVETNELAKQADGSVLVRYGDTVILTATVMNEKEHNLDFFPLMVVYNEKLYSAGKIPGGFIKREGRPSENATLAARLIDRPIRPLFPETFNNEVQIINTVMSVDPDNSPEITALFASSLALGISKMPFDGPVAGVEVGKIGSKFILNPTGEEKEKSELILIVAGTEKDVCMIEAEAHEASEQDILDAINFGHKHIKELCQFQNEIIKVIGMEKLEVKEEKGNSKVEKEVEKFASNKLKEILRIKDKLTNYSEKSKLKEETINHILEKYPDEASEKSVSKLYSNLESEIIRDLILNDKIRSDGRELNEIRDLSAYIDVLPRAHGSAVFTRGQTQALSTTTLGAMAEHQILDDLGVENSKRFILHYNFPSFSVGETGRYMSPNRREIGHGALGEKALLKVIPSESDFPYTIRVVSEILESNGSSSQASIVAGCLSLMAAGVPIKAPVAGIAMGLITKGRKYAVLTDIAGIEDHMGDMDFKVAGTKKGITAIQMDIKLKGVTKKILKESLSQAKEARLEILKMMSEVIEKPRKELSAYAPKIKVMQIKPEQIKEVIGRGGEVITKVILEASNVNSVNDVNAVKVDLEDDGKIIIYHTDANIINKTVEMIEEITKEVEDGQVYTGEVVTVQDFGCFVKLWEGTEGLVHVSQLDTKRVDKPSDIVKVGDEIVVKSLGYDNRGRLNLSRKAVLNDNKKESDSKKSDKKEEKKPDDKKNKKIDKKEESKKTDKKDLDKKTKKSSKKTSKK